MTFYHLKEKTIYTLHIMCLLGTIHRLCGGANLKPNWKLAKSLGATTRILLLKKRNIILHRCIY